MSTVSFTRLECVRCGLNTEGKFTVDYPAQVNQIKTHCNRCNDRTLHLMHGIEFDPERQHCMTYRNRAHALEDPESKNARICPWCNRPNPAYVFGTV